MIKLEKIKFASKIVAIVIRNNLEIKEGINFFTKPQEPLQIALHNYKSKKETLIHNNKIRKPLALTEKYKYLHITRGKADIELSNEKGKIIYIIQLKSGDSMIIMDIFHKVIFSKNSKAIEIKQGPYNKNNEQ